MKNYLMWIANIGIMLQHWILLFMRAYYLWFLLTLRMFHDVIHAIFLMDFKKRFMTPFLQFMWK